MFEITCKDSMHDRPLAAKHVYLSMKCPIIGQTTTQGCLCQLPSLPKHDMSKLACQYKDIHFISDLWPVSPGISMPFRIEECSLPKTTVETGAGGCISWTIGEDRQPITVTKQLLTSYH